MDNEIKECDVTKCEHYNKIDGACHINILFGNAEYDVPSNFCDETPNCHYKQLLAEQAKNKNLVEALEFCVTDVEPTSINWRLLQINENVKQALNEVNK